MSRGILSMAGSGTPLQAEYDRLVRRLLERSEVSPERTPDDHLVGQYDPQVRTMVAGNWRARMRQEHHSAAVFAGMLPDSMRAGVPVDLKMALLRASMDELRHAVLCASVAQMLDGVDELECELEPAPQAEHEGVSIEQAFLRNIFFVGCLSETVAVALLTDERDACEEPFVRRVLTQLLGDETLHARIGWIWLQTLWPRMSSVEQRQMNDYLRIALGYYEQCMLQATSGPPVPTAALQQARRIGFADSGVSRDLFHQAMEHVVLPRLDEIGLEGSAAWRERSQHCATSVGSTTLVGGGT